MNIGDSVLELPTAYTGFVLMRLKYIYKKNKHLCVYREKEGKRER